MGHDRSQSPEVSTRIPICPTVESRQPRPQVTTNSNRLNQAMQPTAGRRTFPLRFLKSRTLQAELVDSFAPAQSPLPRGFTVYPAISHNRSG